MIASGGPVILDVIPNVIAGFADAGAIAFVIIYATFSNWRSTAPGRSLMYAVASLAALLLMNTLHLALAPYPGIQFVRIFVYAALFVSVWRLVIALIHILLNGSPITLETFVDPKNKEKHK